MHLLAAAILVLEVILLFVLDKIHVIEALDWVGWFVWALGMAMIVLSITALRRRGHVRPGSSFVETQSLVTDGIFAIIRHPLYLGWTLMYGVPLLFNPRPELAILALAGLVAVQVFSRQEEKNLIAQYGDEYLVYSASVPRMDLLTGILRALRRRQEG